MIKNYYSNSKTNPSLSSVNCFVFSAREFDKIMKSELSLTDMQVIMFCDLENMKLELKKKLQKIWRFIVQKYSIMGSSVMKHTSN